MNLKVGDNPLTTDDMINKIHDIVLAGRRVKIKQIADFEHISYVRKQNILREKLGMKKISARWVPRLLTVDYKQNCMTTSKHCLDKFKQNPKEFLWRFVTVDKTLIHHYTSKIEQSKQWISLSETTSKKAKTFPSAGKVVAIVFLNSQGIIFTDSFQKETAKAGQYYANLLDRFNAELIQIRQKLAKKVLFLHKTANSSAITTAKLVELRYELLPHPPHSPDLAPFDFFCFQT